MDQHHVDTQRRKILTGALGLGGVGTAVGLGVLAPSQALASWREESIMATSLEEGLNAVLGASEYEESDEIHIDAPEVAENGETVPITIDTSLPDVESITVYVPENNAPVSAVFELGGKTKPKVSQRIQMADTSDVVAVAKSNGKLYGTSRRVRVTIGGCGG
ncbi:thiosulfate oxidation carrier protein SoxY [Halorhodospira halophila]|uniref:Thiosulfate-binding protein SoxY n=1 Tax=Halorhodospira halophila (strain DSM 244 / SL1) TaxID=349124 RepID=A1WYE3_HALHL|nr:thiosulfate oxidation carrier protein SoxY [Halorhodospira halophila]ABM62705.1 thiosulfate-binding protein SoxY [Halorhodospira halophila SL1]MBK1728386.1 thiosulfate oxidation carrier protein SoxY [Halorhodospira halophila]